MKRLAGILLFCVAILAFFPACGTVDSSAVDSDLTREVNRLQGLYKEAVRVPITPQIVTQVRKDEKDYLLGEIRYFTSVNIALMHSRAGESSMTVETKELPRVRRMPVRPAGDSQNVQESPQDAASAASITFQEIPVLIFREGGSSLDQRRITSDDEGHLKNLNPGGDVFEIHYPDRGVTLGFTLNREENWYDLEFAVDESTGERTSLAMTGIRPHLMINYQTVFPFGETRIQMDKTLPQGELPPKAGGEEPPRPVPPFPDLPPETAATEPLPDFRPEDDAIAELPVEAPLPGGQSAPPAESFAEEWPPYPGDDDEIAGLETGGGGLYLEEALPTPWDTGLEEDLYLGEGESPDVEVVFLEEKTVPPANRAEPVSATERTAPVDPGSYVVQAGAFRETRNASAAFAALERAGFYPFYESYQGLTRVLIPAVAREDLDRVREKLKALGFGEPYVRR
ncbi:MAG: SPOR domain-containing protein [Treponema sp.]|jgi:hypothetical protein|nr:SPOR domain-containing protein [Treponema sp.]